MASLTGDDVELSAFVSGVQSRAVRVPTVLLVEDGTPAGEFVTASVRPP